MKKEIIYQLTQNLPYAQAGEMIEGKSITLTAPTSKNMTECAFLKQAFFRALPKVTAETSPGTADAGEVTGDGVMALITMSPDVSLSSVLLTARELFASGLALVDGEQRLNKPLLDALSPDDLEAMTGEYMANFILASALQKLKKS